MSVVLVFRAAPNWCPGERGMKGSLSLIALFLEWCDQAHTLLPLSHNFSSLSPHSIFLVSLSLLGFSRLSNAEHQTDTQINVSLSLHPPSIPCVTSRLQTAQLFFFFFLPAFRTGHNSLLARNFWAADWGFVIVGCTRNTKSEWLQVRAEPADYYWGIFVVCLLMTSHRQRAWN